MPENDPYAATAEQGDPYAQTAESDRASTKAVFSGAGIGTSPTQEGKVHKAVRNTVENFNSGFGISPATKPSDVPKGFSLAVRHPGLLMDSLKTMYMNASAEQQRQIDEAYQLQHTDGALNKANGFAKGFFASIPLMGPAINDLGDKFDKKDWSGFLGGAAALGLQVLGPKAREAKVAEAPKGEVMAGPDGTMVGKPGVMGEIQSRTGEGVGTKMRRMAQQVTGSSQAATTDPMIEKFKERSEKTAELNAASVDKAEKTNLARTEDGFRKSGERKAAYEKKVAEQKADLKAAREKANAEYEAKKAQIETTNAAEKAKVEQRLKTTKDRDIESAQLNQEIQNLEKSVRREADDKFAEVRKQVGNAETDSAPLIESVDAARKQVLGEYPEGVKEFDVIMRLQGNAEEMTELRNEFSEGLGYGSDYEALSPERKKFVDDRIAIDQESLGETPTENKPINWQLAQALKTHIETKLRSRATPPAIKRALYAVRETLVEKIMGGMVEAADKATAAKGNNTAAGAAADTAFFQQAKAELPNGSISDWSKRAQELKQQAPPPLTLSQKWQAARQFWRQYREDFYTPQGPSGSGSPVARALDADPRDPYSTRRPFLDPTVENTQGNRGVDILKKYARFGGDKVADRVRKIIKQSGDIGDLPKKASEKPLPAGPKGVDEPKPIPPPKPVEVKYVEPKQYKAPQPPTKETVTKAKLKKIRDASVLWAKFNRYDASVFAGSAIGPFFGHWETLIAEPAFIAARQGFARVLNAERVRNWIAQPMPEELKALNSMPGVMQDEIRGNMKSFVEQNKGITVHPSVTAFLYGKKRPSDADWRSAGEKTPGEMKKEINAIRNRRQAPTSSNPAMPNGQ